MKPSCYPSRSHCEGEGYINRIQTIANGCGDSVMVRKAEGLDTVSLSFQHQQ